MHAVPGAIDIPYQAVDQRFCLTDQNHAVATQDRHFTDFFSQFRQRLHGGFYNRLENIPAKGGVQFLDAVIGQRSRNSSGLVGIIT